MKHYKIKSIFPILCIFMAFVLSSCSQTANEKDTLSKSLTAESFLSQMQIKNNIEELFLQKNEILSTASVYNITYGLDNYRKMYLFSSPVREYANQQLVTINRSIKTGENALFEVHNSSYDILFFENKILLTNFYQNISLYIEELTE